MEDKEKRELRYIVENILLKEVKKMQLSSSIYHPDYYK